MKCLVWKWYDLCSYAIHDTTWQSSVAADSDVILPCRFKPDSLGVAAKSDSDDTDSQAKD